MSEINQLVTISNNTLVQDIRLLINQAKTRVARVANSEMTILYWHIGKRIKKEILKCERAEYGQQIVRTLALHLAVEYGKGFTYTSITRMIKFYDSFADYEIVATASQQLSWSHIIELLPLQDINQRDFYIYIVVQDGLSVRQLRSAIHKMTYERSELSKKSAAYSEQIMSVLKSDNN